MSIYLAIALGGSLGAIVGPKIASLGKDHTYLLMVGAAGILGVCLLIYNTVNRMQARRGAGDDAADDEPEEDEPLGKEGGFELLRKQRYLLFIALMVLVANLVNTTGEYVLGNAAETHAAEVVPDPSPTIMAMPRPMGEGIQGRGALSAFTTSGRSLSGATTSPLLIPASSTLRSPP